MSRLDRQSFLGERSDAVLAGATVGIIGLGGGGGHLVQQLAHLGVGGYVLADPQIIDDTNTNRLIGGTLADVVAGMAKVAIAARTIRGLVPDARIEAVQASWADAAESLKTCDIIVGAVDNFVAREELERFSRRNLIPYVDIGMDVHDIGEDGRLISGQVILSTPGRPCLRCCGLVTDARLKREAEDYGAAGPRPHVVWPNGVLASTAVGVIVSLLTPWHRACEPFQYLEYDGNLGVVRQNVRMTVMRATACPHHPAAEVGDPLFDVRSLLQPEREEPKSKPGWWMRLHTAVLRILSSTTKF